MPNTRTVARVPTARVNAGFTEWTTASSAAVTAGTEQAKNSEKQPEGN